MDGDIDMPGFESVHLTWSEVDADVVVSFLLANGIEASLQREFPRSVLPLTVDGIGCMPIVVAREDAERARALLAEVF